MQNNTNPTINSTDTAELIHNLKNLIQVGHMKPAELVVKLQEKLSDLQVHLHVLSEVLKTD